MLSVLGIYAAALFYDDYQNNTAAKDLNPRDVPREDVPINYGVRADAPLLPL
ncbi:MAG: hypothetical protein V4474_00305 [Patescibacteria group bacterium]